jgi:hypothetical protein
MIINTENYQASVSRDDLTVIVITFDIMVCITFVIMSGLL